MYNKPQSYYCQEKEKQFSNEFIVNNVNCAMCILLNGVLCGESNMSFYNIYRPLGGEYHNTWFRGALRIIKSVPDFNQISYVGHFVL